MSHDAGNYPIKVKRSRSYDRTFTYKINGSAVNLTGYSATMNVRKVAGSTAILTLTNGSGITLGGALGTVTIALTPAQTDAFAAGEYYYDVELSSGGNDIDFLEGSFKVKA